MLNKSSLLAPALGVTKIIIIMYWVTLCCPAQVDLDDQQTLLSTVDLVLTSLDQLLFTWKMLFGLVTKQATLMRRSTLLTVSLPWAGCKWSA